MAPLPPKALNPHSSAVSECERRNQERAAELLLMAGSGAFGALENTFAIEGFVVNSFSVVIYAYHKYTLYMYIYIYRERVFVLLLFLVLTWYVYIYIYTHCIYIYIYVHTHTHIYIYQYHMYTCGSLFGRSSF